ncbi:hypothetical protein AWRIB429_0908 [Oenococcus oeni AWRIB429]|uniref:Uncharacterized protein n=2 Tax=Oenococcus oeni TaxID=1247 RepID=Q04FC6_OENOB|nr:hypothetical protein OEOE_0932 [Oenococcus oeni PSU-1]EFD88488.1 hypothetical protein AWRIB429_0908 [Oenococcus oeni AWRIB429]KEP85766.1 hypothetical protein X278_07035 [Oenococcus oeni IOEB_0205]
MRSPKIFKRKKIKDNHMPLDNLNLQNSKLNKKMNNGQVE